jgi:hypothetical protein
MHTDTTAAHASHSVSARAFTFGSHIFLGGGERPTDLALMAHEVTHVIQQRGAPMVQLSSSAGPGNAFEREAQRASAAAVHGERVNVREHVTAPRIQRLGIGDALDYFADKAYNIPGYRMFTIILGVNPINMSRVERSAANILRALIEFIPGGHLITEALDTYGIFDRVGAWVDQQIQTLGLTGSSIKRAIMDFLDSLGWRDIFHLGDVWERAKRIFTDPIDRIINFARNLVVGIIRFVKDAILKPLAKLAEGTRGYDLLKAVLGQDPITGEAVPRNADTLIGGFMKLIGQEEVWNNLKRANAVARAWAWFQGALGGLLGYVRQIPALFISALQQLELVDIVLVPRAFGKIARVFGGFIGSFLSWAGQQVLSLLQIIFEVVAPAVMPYLRKAAGAFRAIIQNPVGFVGNLVRAGIQGFKQFGLNFLNHLKKSLIDWLTGTLVGGGVYIPQALELREIVKFVLSVLGMTWQNIRGKVLRLIPEPALQALETGFDIVVSLVKEGPGAAWEKIRDSLSNLREMVMDGIMNFVRDRIVQAAITRLVTSLNPAGAFIQAVIAIYNTVMFFMERLRQIAQVAMAFIDSMAAIASGNIGTAAARVETVMAGLLTLVISFLARLVGLGRVSDAIKDILNRVRNPLDKALDKVVEWIVATAKRVGKFITGAVQRVTGRPAAPAGPQPRQPTGIAEEAGRLLVERVSGQEKTEDEIRATVSQIASELRPRGLKRFEIGATDPQGNHPVVAEASPLSVTALLRLARRGYSVRMASTVHFTAPQQLATARTFTSSGRAFPGAPGQFIHTASVAEGGVLVHPDPRGRLTAVPPPETIVADKVQVTTFNRGDRDPRRDTNETHAEVQFISWFRSDVRQESIQYLASVDMQLSRSPCSQCVIALCAFRRTRLGAVNVPLRLRWTSIHTGDNPTTTEDIADLIGCGFDISGNPRPTISRADAGKQSRFAVGRIGG